MVRSLVKVMAVTAVAVGFSSLSGLPASAAGPYDGNWVMTSGQVGGQDETGFKCPAIRLPFEIKDNQISGHWEYVQTGPGIPTVEAVSDNGKSNRDAAAFTGNVNPDGTFTAKWMSFQTTGKLTGDKLEMSWRGECGPRMATGGRASS